MVDLSKKLGDFSRKMSDFSPKLADSAHNLSDNLPDVSDSAPQASRLPLKEYLQATFLSNPIPERGAGTAFG
ncbi:hypothetical protein [Bacillus massilinigeriensis]|uniref:hypothetical protein n=1 Tax=Bacillus mediterraneensis TaxID=1805474 RepID=UPI0008F8628D|nr:hypothetical protein [Bacillus mediterraneensis]